MKFEFEKTINDVVTFDVNGFGLFFLSKDMSVSGFSDLKLNEENFSVHDTSLIELFLSGDFLCITEAYSRCIVFDLANDKKRLHASTEDTGSGFTIRNESLSNRRELLRFNINGDLIVGASIWNVDTNKQQSTPYSFVYWYDDGKYIFSIHQGFSAICRLSPEGSEIWTHRASGEYKSVTGRVKANNIRDVLGIHNDLLWLTDNSGSIYSLNLETGEVFSSLTGVGSIFKYMIEPERNRLVALQGNRICIVNIGEKELSHRSTDISELFDAKVFNPDYFGMLSKLPIVNSHIIFPDAQNAVIGVFDIDSAQVTWQYDLYADVQLGTIKQMKYYGNVLYVRCSDDSLHMFNRVS